MALMHVDFFSHVLGLNCQMDVILPQKNQGIGVEGNARTGRWPVLWLLHGASDDHTIWQRRTSIERYASTLGIAVIMPAVQLSFYTNMHYGGRYFDFVADELPEIVRDFFDLSPDREDNWVAGLSMGGYGALKIGLSRPEQYSAIGCLSAGNFVYSDLPRHSQPGPMQNRFLNVFGVRDLASVKGTEHDLFHLAEQAAAQGKPLPRIFHACGTEDFLLANARRTRDWFSVSEYNYTYREGEGAHTWEFWDEWIQVFLDWLS